MLKQYTKSKTVACGTLKLKTIRAKEKNTVLKTATEERYFFTMEPV